MAPVQSAAATDASPEEDDDDYLHRIEGEMNQRSAANRMSSGARANDGKKTFQMAPPKRSGIDDGYGEDDGYYVDGTQGSGSTFIASAAAAFIVFIVSTPPR